MTMSFSIAVSLFVSFTHDAHAGRALAQARTRSRRPPPSLLEKSSTSSTAPSSAAYMALLTFGHAFRRWPSSCIAAFLTLAPMGKLAGMRAQGLSAHRRPRAVRSGGAPTRGPLASPATELVGERVARIIRQMPEVTATLAHHRRRPGQDARTRRAST
jgi:hypothetical protein